MTAIGAGAAPHVIAAVAQLPRQLGGELAHQEVQRIRHGRKDLLGTQETRKKSIVLSSLPGFLGSLAAFISSMYIVARGIPGRRTSAGGGPLAGSRRASFPRHPASCAASLPPPAGGTAPRTRW